MPDPQVGAFGTFLASLRTTPVWLLGGVALAAFAVIYAPGFGGIDPAGFRTEWGVWIWIVAILFSLLALTRSIDSGLTRYVQRKRREAERHVIRFSPRYHQSWWHLAKQNNDKLFSQIAIELDTINLSDLPIHIVSASLIRPRVQKSLEHALVMVPSEFSNYHSSDYPIPPHSATVAKIDLMVRKPLAPRGKPLSITIAITDQLGIEHRLRGITIRSIDAKPPRQSILDWARSRLVRLKAITGRREAGPQAAIGIPTEWDHHGKFDEADLILAEERRSYAACGRRRGGLGSLNVGLQSEPNFGWTEEGKVPSLLWKQEDAKAIGSLNLERIVRFHSNLHTKKQQDLENYLLSHLNWHSRFADVAYFIFLALHRMDRTIDAMKAAQENLSGDKVYGYSNLLGLLSALISHEHFLIRPELFPRMLDTIEGDAEPNFRLVEKINLARLECLDQSLNTRLSDRAEPPISDADRQATPSTK